MSVPLTPRPLRVCGTAAAEAIPGLHCACPTCVEALRRGGPDIRSRTAYDLGEDIRVDFGPDSFLHAREAGRNYASLRHLLVTHSHADHWQPGELGYRRPGFCVVPDGPPLRVWGNDHVLAAARAAIHDLDACRIELHHLGALQTLEIEPGVEVTTLRAAHAHEEEALNLLITENGRTVLIGHDTGWWDEPTWEFVAGRPIDVALIDATYGRYDESGGHLGAASVVRFVDRLREIGCLAGDAKVLATHFSHNGHALHEELVDLYAPAGISVAYDGLVIG